MEPEVRSAFAERLTRLAAMAAKPGQSTAVAITTMPASCTTAMAGIATRFNRTPATLTRENASAVTGNNQTSAASVAATRTPHQLRAARAGRGTLVFENICTIDRL